MTNKGKIILIPVLVLAMLSFALYGTFEGKSPEQKVSENESISAEETEETAERLMSEAESTFQNDTAVRIDLNDKNFVASAGVQTDDQTITITSPGIYRITGALTDRQLAVNCKGDVILIFDGVEIRNSADDAINIIDTKHALIYLPENSSNILESGSAAAESGNELENATEESASGATIFSKDDLFIGGKGNLTVNGYLNNAIATTDHLVILGGNLELTAANIGLKGKDSVTIQDGNIHIECGGDGIKSNNDTDDTCGNIDIQGGEITIVSQEDGIQAERKLTVEGGEVTITAGEFVAEQLMEESFGEMPPEMLGMMPGGQISNQIQQEGEIEEFQRGHLPKGQMSDQMQNGGRHREFINGQMPEANGQMPEANGQMPDINAQRGMKEYFNNDFSNKENSDFESATSAKGLKSGSDLIISGGTITINSADDCIHTNGSLEISGGTFQLASNDDGLHADDTLTIIDGEISISQSYEGIEGHFIHLTGGDISVTASDDGINAGGGQVAGYNQSENADSTDFSLPKLQISGGNIYVNAAGDGLDSNGDLIIDGGTIIIDGPTNNGNGALDSGSEFGGMLVCNGGTILAIGSSGMAESFGNTSNQPSFLKNLSQTMPAGTEISIKDENGDLIYQYESAKSFNSVVFSSPDLILGKTYTISAGEVTEEIVIEEMSNASADDTSFSRPFFK